MNRDDITAALGTTFHENEISCLTSYNVVVPYKNIKENALQFAKKRLNVTNLKPLDEIQFNLIIRDLLNETDFLNYKIKNVDEDHVSFEPRNSEICSFLKF